MRVLLPFIIGGVIFSGTVIFWKTSSTQELSYIERTVKLKSNEITSHVQDNIEERVLSLERMAKRWEKKGRPGRNEWEADANLYISHYAGYRAIGWINDRGFVEWSVPVSGEHDKDFSLKETRQSALIKAKNGLDASISPKVALPDGGSVIMITVPVYAKGRFEGVIAGVFNIQELMDSILLHEFEGGYAVAVRNNNEEIYRSNDQGRDAWAVDSGFSISDSLWRVTAWPRAETLRGMRSSLPVAILGAGAIIAVLLPLAFYFGQTAIDREKATDAVNQKLGDEIAERKRMEGALTESESRLRSIMNNSTAVIYLKDLEGKYILVNHRYEVIFNTTNGFVSGKTDHDLFPKEIAAALRGNDVKAIEPGTSEEFEETILQSDGAHTYITIKFPLLDSKAIPYAVCGFSTDITKRKKAEELAGRQAKELARSNEELEQYA
ncbi:MAG: PAS domain-containing protein, partial [Deltaproteobacteria bacterium]|nr:PAS domain-containing protein [Deltaproteobacteria bacterium]